MTLYEWILVPALFVAELIYFRIADRFGITDRPNARSSHAVATRRGGGVIFPFASALWFCAHDFAFPWFFAGLVLIATVSFLDDIFSVANKLRLLCHFAAFALMFHEQALFTAFPPAVALVALIFCVGITNAYNFMDGINGITGAYSLAVLGALAWANVAVAPFADASFLATILAAVGVFCVFNFRKKALCFAGDVGSVSIAFIILFLLGRLMIETRDVSWIVLLLVYGTDSVLTIVHRLMLRENIGTAHRKHLYQILSNELRVPHVVVSLGYFAVQAVISSAFVLAYPAGTLARWGILFGAGTLLSAFYVVFMKKYFHLHRQK